MRKTILAAALALLAVPAAAQTQPLLGYGTWYDVPSPPTYPKEFCGNLSCPNVPANAVHDGTGEFFRYRISKNSNPLGYCGTGTLTDVWYYPLRLNRSGTVWQGATFQSETNPDIAGWDRNVFIGSSYCNSAAILWSVPSTIGNGVVASRIDRAWDGIRFAGDNCVATVGACFYMVDGVWISTVMDDAIEIDKLASAVIRDTLIDGAFSGISTRWSSSAPDHSADTITLDHVLMRLRAFPAASVTSGGGFDSGGPFKVEGKSPMIAVYDSIIAFDHYYWERQAFWSSGWGKVDPARCGNNLLLWLNDTAIPSGFPAIPACFTLIQGAQARLIWQQARADWITRHNDVPRLPGDPQ